MELLFTKDTEWLKKWDDYVHKEDKASHLLYSDWNKSFQSYDFDFEICIAVENNQIIGGYAAVIAKVLFLKLYIVPFGPIISIDSIKDLNKIIESISFRAKAQKCCYFQFNLPVSENINKHVFNNLENIKFGKNINQGHLFKYVYSTTGLNWVDLKDFDEESKIMDLKPSVRRNIRNSYRKELRLEVLDTKEKIKLAYDLFLENAKSANYSIREWKSIKETLYQLNYKKHLKILAAFKNDELKGAILLVKAGNYYTYILGGSKKEVPDLRTGDFLQWEAIKLSLNENLDGYNISLGGSKGVIDFKNSFNTQHFYFDKGQFHGILNSFYFKIFMLFDKHLNRHKKSIAILLNYFKRW